MGSSSSVPLPTPEDLAKPHDTLDPPLSTAVFPEAGTGMIFHVPRDAWTNGCVIPELGCLRVVPDATAKFYQGSRCTLYLQDTCVGVLLSHDALRIHICTLLPGVMSSKVPGEQHDGQPLYEYAVITKKHDSPQHVLHIRGVAPNDSNDRQPKLVTANVRKSPHHDRAVHSFTDPTDVWAVVSDQPDATWRVQTAAGVDPILLLAFCVGTDRFVKYVNEQHLRRTATLESKSRIGAK